MEKLDMEVVEHVADLAKLHLSEEEKNLYAYQLKDIMDEVNKIENIEIDDEILISPCQNTNKYNEDECLDMLSREEVLKNANKKYGSYIAVTRALND